MVENLTPPLLTVLMPVYNGAKYLREAIESILAQTYRDFEFLIIDDGSTDDSPAILASYTDRRIRIIRNENNLGLPATLNKGLALIQSPLIARMDCDDISLPSRLEKQVAYLQDHFEIGIAGSNYRLINPEGVPGIVSDLPSQHALIRWRLLFGSPMAHPCTMIRTTVLRQLGGYRPLVVAQDYDLWQRAAWQTRLANLPEILLYLRYHNTSSSRNQQTQTVINSNQVAEAVMERILGEPPPPDLVEPIRTWQFRNSEEARRAGDLIIRLCHANDKDRMLTVKEKRLIRADAAKWVWRIAIRQDWRLAAQAWQIDPLLPVHFPLGLLKRITDNVFR